MKRWGEASKTNLLSLSKEQQEFELALREWEHTGIVKDHLSATELCQLCEHSNLRYHFEILNRVTQATLQVGSSCIHKFDITVYDDGGNELVGKAKSEKLDAEISEKHREMMLEPLRSLWQADESSQDFIQLAVSSFNERSGFSPENLLKLFRLMEKHQIEYARQIYKVVLRSNQDKNELFAMKEDQLEFIWPGLSSSQRQRYQKGAEKFKKQQKRDKKRVAEQQEKWRKLYSSLTESTESPRQSIEQRLVDLRRKEMQKSLPGRLVEKLPASANLPDKPIFYDERAHKYTVTFFGSGEIPFKRVFRGEFRALQKYIEAEVQNHPDCTLVEVSETATKKLVDTYRRT